MSEEKLREELAEYAHNQWAGWMKYLFKQCDFVLPSILGAIKNGSAIIPEESVKRWMRQIDTKYKDLSEEEKESDRKEADGMIKIFKKYKGDFE